MKTKLHTFAFKQILGKPIKKLVKKWLKYSIPMTVIHFFVYNVYKLVASSF